jgi:hypothetical protein
VGRRAAGWPFARIGIGPYGLRVRLGFPWFITRSAAKQNITAVSVSTRRMGAGYCLRFEDSSGRLRDVHVHPPSFRSARVVDELRRCGFAVVDGKSGAELEHLPKRRRWR